MTHLPGYGPPPTPQYSGFLDASAAEPGTKLHYWFARADASDWATKPTFCGSTAAPGAARSWAGFRRWAPPRQPHRRPDAQPVVVDARGERVCSESPAGVGGRVLRGAARRACANTDNPPRRRRGPGGFFPKQVSVVGGEPVLRHGRELRRCLRPDAVARHPDHNDAGGFPIPLAGLAAGTRARITISNETPWTCSGTGYARPREARRFHLWELGAASGTPAKSRGGGRETRDGLRGARGGRRRARGGRGSAAAAAKRYRGSTSRTRRPSARGAAAVPPRHLRRVLAGGRRAWLNDLSLYGPSAVVRDDVPGTLTSTCPRGWLEPTRARRFTWRTPADVWPGPSDDWSYESQWGRVTTRAARDALDADLPVLAPRLRRTIVSTATRTRACRTRAPGWRSAAGFGTRRGAQRPWPSTPGVRLALLDEKPPCSDRRRGSPRGRSSRARHDRARPARVRDRARERAQRCRSFDRGRGCTCSGTREGGRSRRPCARRESSRR